ncbi:MAG: hypothetical protein LBR00_04775, partial [Clostridiales Family XIII bacterium]|nr:hypothetical protein [Clostridiales Family XIII bacterium]
MFDRNMKILAVALAAVLVAGLAVPTLTLAGEGAEAPPAEAAQEAPAEVAAEEAVPAESDNSESRGGILPPAESE